MESPSLSFGQSPGGFWCCVVSMSGTALHWAALLQTESTSLLGFLGYHLQLWSREMAWLAEKISL